MAAAFLHALDFARELAFGVLAIAGCAVVQCLLLTWILLAKVQIRFVLLQAQILRQIYRQTKKSRHSQSEEKPTKIEDVEHVPRQPSLQTPPIELPTTDRVPPKATALNAEAPIWQTKVLTARMAGAKRPYAVKQVDALAPSISPGFEQQARVLGPRTKSPATFPKKAIHLSPYAVPFSMAPHWNADVLGLLHDTTPTANPTVRPPGLPLSTKRNEDNKRKAQTKYIVNTPSENLCERWELYNKTAGNGKLARRSAIKKAQPAGHEEVTNRRDVSPISPENTNHFPNVEVTGTIHSHVKPATLSELRHKFVDTSLLKETSADEYHQVDQAQAKPAHNLLLNPEEAAREALSAAFNEREITRVKLNTGYTHNIALEFDAKAKAYKISRQELATLMPLGCLSMADEEVFPNLSTKDTLEPKITAAASKRTEEPNVLPSPPTSSEDEAFEPKPREDPGPLIAKASRAYQVLIQATRNLKEQCTRCDSNFCMDGYEGIGKLKLKTARDLYLRTRGTAVDVYNGDKPPKWLLEQLPEIKSC